MRRRRKSLPPSTGHYLVRLNTDNTGRRLLGAEVLKKHIDIIKPKVLHMVGFDRVDWAIRQLLELPEVVHPARSARRRKVVR